MKLLFYSEILDQHYAVCVTRRTVSKIEEATTFDHYILKVEFRYSFKSLSIIEIRSFQTPLQDLNSKFGFDLRRQMLHKLVNNGEHLWPTDSEKKTTIFNKYKQYQISVKNKQKVFFIFFEVNFTMKLFRNKKSTGLV